MRGADAGDGVGVPDGVEPRQQVHRRAHGHRGQQDAVQAGGVEEGERAHGDRRFRAPVQAEQRAVAEGGDGHREVGGEDALGAGGGPGRVEALDDLAVADHGVRVGVVVRQQVVPADQRGSVGRGPESVRDPADDDEGLDAGNGGGRSEDELHE